jgi:hypothetical protein
MTDDKRHSRALTLDPNASSADPSLPAFLGRPEDAQVYHGFPILEGSWTADSWCFGSITEYGNPNGIASGDAFVQAADGSRAGIVWEVGSGAVSEICAPEPGRWGVYAVWFPRPIASRVELIEALHSVLPQLRDLHRRVHERSDTVR